MRRRSGFSGAANRSLEDRHSKSRHRPTPVRNRTERGAGLQSCRTDAGLKPCATSSHAARTTMRTSFFAVLGFFVATAASAQTPPALRLTVDEAVKMALDNNIDLAADRLDPQ